MMQGETIDHQIKAVLLERQGMDIALNKIDLRKGLGFFPGKPQHFPVDIDPRHPDRDAKASCQIDLFNRLVGGTSRRVKDGERPVRLMLKEKSLDMK